MTHDKIARLATVYGIDIKYRRQGTNWPYPWRVRIVYTLDMDGNMHQCFYGATLDEALDAAEKYVADQRKQWDDWSKKNPFHRPFTVHAQTLHGALEMARAELTRPATP
jgi:hypothetical protein